MEKIKKNNKVRFENVFGVMATVEIHWVGKYHYWLEINGCQETRTQSIPNPWIKLGNKNIDLSNIVGNDLDVLRKAETEKLKIEG